MRKFERPDTLKLNETNSTDHHVLWKLFFQSLLTGNLDLPRKHSSVTFVYADLIYFTTRVANTNDTSATRVLHERHECDSSEKL